MDIMENEQFKNERIDQVMNSLDGISRATAPTHLYTRIMGRLTAEESRWMLLAKFLSRPFVAVAMSLLLLLVNGWFIYQSQLLKPDESTDQISALAVEYHLDPVNLLDQNNNLP